MPTNPPTPDLPHSATTTWRTRRSLSGGQGGGDKNLGIAGYLAQTFIRSKLTVLLAFAAVLLGLFATLKLPREEEPQIKVPMFDVFVPFPGAGAKEVEERIINVGERKLWEIPDVEYIYTTAEPNFALFILRFKVGTNPEEAMTRVYTKTFANTDMLPPGSGQPLIKPRSIDDVPVLALTISGKGLDPLALRRAAATLRQEVSAVPNVSETTIIGGRRRQFLVHFSPAKLAAYRLTPLDIAGIIQASNKRLPAGHLSAGPETVLVATDAFIRSADELKRVIVGISGGSPVQLNDVASVTDGPDEEEQEVWTSPSLRAERSNLSLDNRLPRAASLSTKEDAALAMTSKELIPAVTLSVSKRHGANATEVVQEILRRVDHAKTLLPADLEIRQTRNYGATAKQKSDELLSHVFLATLSVTLLIAFALGWREALVVLVAVPVTLALTLVIYTLFGYTLNRITLFALIFSIGILVDDAIVVIENIHRHSMMKDGRTLWQLSVEAVAEVGNPTILATWTVIAAILPMAFVGGLMGPYMRPIPVGASFAMIFSLAVAFIISPWAFAHILEKWPPAPRSSSPAVQSSSFPAVVGGESTPPLASGGAMDPRPEAAGDDVKSVAVGNDGDSRLDHFYRKFMRVLLENGKIRAWYFGVMVVLLLGAVSLVFLKAITVKMLPFDNKDEFEVVLNMPDSASLSATRQAALEMAGSLEKLPETRRVTAYVGTAAPYNFNGLVRHYFLRQRPNQADIVVNLSDRHDRKRQSHQIAKEARLKLAGIAKRYQARFQVAEIPPGPPVLSTLVFEIYGPDAERRMALSKKLQELLRQTDGIVDVDTYVRDPQPKDLLKVNREKATLNAIPALQVAQTVSLAIDGQTVDLAHAEEEKEPVEIRLRLAEPERRNLDAAGAIRLYSRNGTAIAIRELTRAARVEEDQPVYHKNLLPVTYVIADVAGKQESPVYAILALRPKIDALAKSMGIDLKQEFSATPKSSLTNALKWDGEWQITYEVFRDLGIAFAVVLVLIYILVVAWFQSFTIPLVIMVPIPLTLVGILPGHWLLGAFFTATSMIGFIAGAGIVVRNSIILVDFIQLRQREGMSLEEAVIDAGAVRFRPMLLTAAAVVVGAGVILFDPIFQGLAVALMAGEVASTLLSRVAVPVLYFLLARRWEPKGA